MDQELLNLLEAAVAETGRSLGGNLESIRQYTAEQMVKLSLAINEPGYADLLIVARNNVAMRAALDVTVTADAADARIVGIIQGALAIGARALAGAA